ncbi:archease [Amycolatopsis alkalitolerans]|uniref:Archease n=1 Tax=Amycolatopsis alkalitolerans TaxID=2547244 RepID=A0A5C4M782_9PSEU|nr:archease [Amycolatopsis alkalitolerans]TNC29134.1 archease [Amycolatopsis alkalitolerans]
MKPRQAAPSRRPVHAGDLRIDAWAGTREACIAEAVDALVGSFLGPRRPAPTSRSSFRVTGSTDAELLRAVLRQVISDVLDRQEVPVATAVTATANGLGVTCRTVSAGSIVPAGALPKSLSRDGALCVRFPSGWWCTARIDV